MTSTPPNATETPDGRFYVFGEGTDHEERFRSVTAAIGRWDKEGLIPWAAKLSADAAFDDLPRLVAALMEPECGRSYHANCTDHEWDVRCPQCRCERCQPCTVRWMRDRHAAESHRRSDEGTRVHHIAEHWVTTGVWLPSDPDIAVYVDSLKRFVAEHGLQPGDWEMASATVINRAFGYAGTLDAIVHIRREQSQTSADLLDRLTPDGADRLDHALVLIDYKSREKTDRAVFFDMPLQLAGYRFAEVVRLRDGSELPMPQVDATAIVQIRPDQAALHLLLAEEPEFAAFVSLLAADGWALERGKRAIGARTFSYAPSVVKLRAADQRRAAAAAKRAQKQDDTGESSPGSTETTSEPPPLSAQERGARAAKAALSAKEATNDVWGDLATTHGKPVKTKASRPVRALETVSASILGAPSEGVEDHIPF